jgi:hypothetical protein
LNEQHLRLASGVGRRDARRILLRPADERLHAIEPEEELANDRDLVLAIENELFPCDRHDGVRRPLDDDAVVHLEEGARLCRRLRPRRRDSLVDHAPRKRDDDDLVVEGHLCLHVAIGEAMRIFA